MFEVAQRGGVARDVHETFHGFLQDAQAHSGHFVDLSLDTLAVDCRWEVDLLVDGREAKWEMGETVERKA